MIDLMCDPASCAGPVDDRVVAALSKRYPLDTDYLAYVNSCHGGEPRLGTVHFAGQTYRLAFFLTLIDRSTELRGPFRPHFDQQDLDERVVNSIVELMDCESNTSRCLFDDLVPFASTQKDMCLDRAYVDLFCFDYRYKLPKPAVVLWESNKALEAWFKWDNLPFDEQFDNNDNFLSVPWDTFLIPMADSFAEFVTLLKPNQ